ncbi:MAG: ABC transporter ATP-binding protein [Halobacteriaceae archaeon]
MVAVAARDVSRRYGDIVAVDGVSLEIESGEIYCLIGPNGAGKTTLVRCLTGTTTVDEGEVEVLGSTPSAVARDRIGLLPQSFAPAPRLTAQELVAYYAGLYDVGRDVDTVLGDVGIDADRSTWYRDLSGGQRRRVCVATALVNDPEILVLDEPTTGIDPAGRRAVWRLLEELRDEGTTVVVTTHDMAEATRLADTVGLLADGSLVVTGSPSSLVAEYGGGNRVVVETDASVTEPIAGFRPVETASGIAFEGVAPTDIGALVRGLDEAGITFAGLRWREPDLEDVYLALTEADRETLEGGQ